MSDLIWGIVVTLGVFILIALYVFFGAGGFGLFNEKTNVIPFPDAKLTKRQRRSALKARVKERRWEKHFSIGNTAEGKLGKSSGGLGGSSISVSKSFKSLGAGRASAKSSKH